MRDPCGIGQALAGVADERWQAFFSQWCQVAELGPIGVQHVRAVAAQLARPESALDDVDELLSAAWAAVRDAMDRIPAGSDVAGDSRPPPDDRPPGRPRVGSRHR